MLTTLIVSGVVGCVLSLLATPLVRRMSCSLGIVDAPDGFRKLHGRDVPLGGGVAVAFSCAVTVVVVSAASGGWINRISGIPGLVMGVAAGAITVCVVGLLDDRYRLRGRQKLLGQVAGVGLAISGGLVIDRVSLFGVEVDLGLLSIPFTLCWLLGAINALNLIDGMDGLATSVGAILSTTVCLLATINGQYSEAVVAAALAGALLGFLPYNWKRARIFLGDAGSMFCGYLIGVLAIRASLTAPTTVALVAPTAIWAIPFLDVGVAILRRKLTGQSIYTTDRGHMHHVLRRAGWGEAQTVMIVGGLCLVCGIGALLSTMLENELAALVTVGSIIAILITTRSFAYPEFQLLVRRLAGFLASCLRMPRILPSNHLQLCSRFHGNRQFQEVWQMLIDFAERFGLSSLNLYVNAPMLGEVYHASWNRDLSLSDRRRLETRIPLIWRSHDIGSLLVHGTVPDGISPISWSSELIDALRPFEMDLLDLLEDDPTADAEADRFTGELQDSPAVTLESVVNGGEWDGDLPRAQLHS